MIINEKYIYPELDTIEKNGKRHYVMPLTGDLLPSVTTILDAVSDKTFLVRWRKRLGNEEADRQSKYAADVGKIMHEHLERHILGTERKNGNNHIHKLARTMADRIINQGLNRLDEVWGLEAALYYPYAYAGRTDLIGVYNGLPSIIDFKNSTKIKKEEWIEGYFLQCCAYALMHNALYDTNIEQIVILMAGREDNGFKSFIINGNEFHSYMTKWIECLGKFMNKN